MVANIGARLGMRVVARPALQQAGIEDKEYAVLLHEVGTGSMAWLAEIKAYERYRGDLTVVDGTEGSSNEGNWTRSDKLAVESV